MNAGCAVLLGLTTSEPTAVPNAAAASLTALTNDTTTTIQTTGTITRETASRTMSRLMSGESEWPYRELLYVALDALAEAEAEICYLQKVIDRVHDNARAKAVSQQAGLRDAEELS